MDYKGVIFLILAFTLLMLLLMLSSSFSSSFFLFLFIRTSAVCRNLLLSDFSILYPELYVFSFLADFTLGIFFFGCVNSLSMMTISFWICVLRSEITFRCCISVFKLFLSSLKVRLLFYVLLAFEAKSFPFVHLLSIFVSHTVLL